MEFGFNNWAAELPRLAKLIDDPRFKPEWLPASFRYNYSKRGKQPGSQRRRNCTTTAAQSPRARTDKFSGKFMTTDARYALRAQRAGTMRSQLLTARLSSLVRRLTRQACKWKKEGFGGTPASWKRLSVPLMRLSKKIPNNRAAKRMRRIVLKELGSANQ